MKTRDRGAQNSPIRSRQTRDMTSSEMSTRTPAESTNSASSTTSAAYHRPDEDPRSGRAELTDPLSPDARHDVVGDVDENARGIDEQRFEHHFGGLSSAR